MNDPRQAAWTLAALLVLVLTPASRADEARGLPADLDEAPPPAPAGSIFRDRLRSPLLDRHYQVGSARASPQVPGRTSREVADRRFRIVYTARTHPGMRVADIGAGSGLFTPLFARAVGPEGLVYGVDGTPDLAAGLQALARQYRVENIVPVVNAREGAGLPAAGVDLVFIYDRYHAFKDPAAMLDSIRKALVPYGSLIIIDDRRPAAAASPPASPWPTRDRGADRDLVAAQVEQAGFRLVEEPDFLQDHFFLRFEKLGDEPTIEVGPIESAAPSQEP